MICGESVCLCVHACTRVSVCVCAHVMRSGVREEACEENLASKEGDAGCVLRQSMRWGIQRVMDVGTVERG